MAGINKIGKQGKINLAANRILKKIYFDKGIRYCEVRIDNKCMSSWGLGFAHRHKRYFYKDKPELLSDFNQTILACSHCHQQLEADNKLTEKVFQCLRD